MEAACLVGRRSIYPLLVTWLHPATQHLLICTNQNKYFPQLVFFPPITQVLAMFTKCSHSAGDADNTDLKAIMMRF